MSEWLRCKECNRLFRKPIVWGEYCSFWCLYESFAKTHHRFISTRSSITFCQAIAVNNNNKVNEEKVEITTPLL